IVSGLFGALLGIGLFAVLRPALAGTAITSAVYFRSEVTPTVWGYLGVLVAVPAASAIASFLALRRVRISPLGVSRRASPPAPGLWRVVPLLAGIALFAVGMLLTTRQAIGGPVFPGLLVIMTGLVIAGPWLTARAAGLLPRFTQGASSIFAARRLADNPKAAFRSVSGLVLAVFLGTMVAALLPAANATTATKSAVALRNVLLDGFTISPVCGNSVNCTGGAGGVGGAGPGLKPGSAATARQRMALEGLPPLAGAKLVAGLRAFHGATIVPVYSMPQDARPGYLGPDTAIVGCAGLRALAALGECAPGVRAAEASASSLYGDNPLYTTQPIVSAHSPTAGDNFSRLYLQAVLVKVNSPATLERVRTYLITHTPESLSGSAPRTFGEAVQARLAVAAAVQRLVDVAVVLTLLVAGCSLAVVVGGGLVERKRPFTMLRLTGTPTSALYRVVLLEAVLPLVAATLVAAGTAYGISVLTAAKIGPAGTPVPGLGHVYYLTMGAGLAASLLVILAALPLLGRITGLENVRFE
ncbi:MAG TPA: FtsX-like permease family protein, partial [Streptosporangiaceae bacterium]|nr:FtsX-like permease family protein [Streptosporangiaceae bacterium]